MKVEINADAGGRQQGCCNSCHQKVCCCHRGLKRQHGRDCHDGSHGNNIMVTQSHTVYNNNGEKCGVASSDKNCAEDHDEITVKTDDDKCCGSSDVITTINKTSVVNINTGGSTQVDKYRCAPKTKDCVKVEEPCGCEEKPETQVKTNGTVIS